ncbi:MAG: type II secretion system F family protein [Robiginitomaculum sp.]|nr:type II secretion system F family protein [Robiginitomaculum sp.]
MSSPTNIVIYILIFACAFLLMQLVIGAGRQGARQIKRANIRMKILAKGGGNGEASGATLKALRQSRGIDDDNQVGKLLRWLNLLVIHSGLRIGAYGLYIAMSICAFVVGTLVFFFTGNYLYFVLGFVAGFGLPVLVVMFIGKRRRKKAVMQLPDALDVIVRSLRAGHPVPVAIDLVAREMPDPIGSEFGLAGDEITYGTELGASVQRLSDRVGHGDFDMLAATVRLQARTGGNLAELLANIAQMVRERQKMRLRIKAASSEGRMSALILNVVPILLFLAVNMLSPEFYGDVSDVPMVKQGLIAAAIWMVIGNVVIRKMINFKI